MEILKLSEISDACGGSFSEEAEVNGICIDTRKITDGCLFICIKGERFDAHQFANEALEKGAAAVMISEYIEVNGPFVKVEDTAKAMLELSGYYRSKFNIPVVGLTGSVGKTTTKEFTHLVVNAKYNAIKTLGNLNNEIGLPQMLFQIDNSVEAAVIEMGMNHFGEIHRLSSAAKPTVGLITNIGVSHIEYLGSREGILKAKLEILDGLADNAPLILNGDNDCLSAKVATLIDADLLILLTDIDGLYDDNPNVNSNASLITRVDEITEELKAVAGGAGAKGTGGFATKLKAAEIATGKGIPVVIMNGAKPTDIYKVLDGKSIGTYFSVKGE